MFGMDIIKTESFYFNENEETDNKSKVSKTCFFRYINGILSYIGVTDTYKVSKGIVDGSVSVLDYNPIFKQYSKDVIVDYQIKNFGTKEEALLYCNHYVRVFKPVLNKRIVNKDDYGVYKQTMFTDPDFIYNTGTPLVVNLLSCYYSSDIISEVMYISEDEINEMCDRIGLYHKTLQTYEYINQKSEIKVDKHMLSHIKHLNSKLLNDCDKRYMKIS